MANYIATDTDLTSVANAIRTKGGTSGQLAFPSGFVSAVQAIPTGTTPTGTKQISITENGTTTEDVAAYANAEITVNVSGGGSGELYYNESGKCFYLENSILPADFSPGTERRSLLAGAAQLKSVKWLYADTFGGSNAKSLTSFFANCPLLETVHLARTNGLSTSGYVEDVIANTPNMKRFIVGDIGYPNTVGMGSLTDTYKLFRNNTVAFEIIIYTSAPDLASVPNVLKNGSPWGATNATVIYKSSVTGEILT